MLELTRKQLDPMGCGAPDCGHDHSVLFLHPACHPTAGTWVKYEKLTGRVTVECKRCKKLVVRIKVASE